MDTKRYSIDEVAFIGRTFAEYERMFGLDAERWIGHRVLDCPAGACSFVASATERGIDAVGADVMYDRTPAVLAAACPADIRTVTAALDGVEDLYVWEFYDDVADLTGYRERAASRFLRDYARHGERYVRAALPSTPFADGAFDLVLSAHFLFLYDDRLSLRFHLETIRELVRVGDQLRIFPLHGFDADRSALLPHVIDTLEDAGYGTEIRDVPFEFQRGATDTLVVQ